jgi:hypothetical protein
LYLGMGKSTHQTPQTHDINVNKTEEKMKEKLDQMKFSISIYFEFF